MIEILPINTLKDNYVWVIKGANNAALIIDPGEATPVIEYLQQNNLDLVGILITHHHWDHTNGIAEILKHWQVPVYASVASQCALANKLLADGETLTITNFPSIQALAIPGHTLDHTAYHFSDVVFTGDTLFTAGCGRIFEGTAEMMLGSLQKLAALPNNTRIYCGHEYTEKNLQFARIVEPSNSAVQARLNVVTDLREHGLPSVPSLLSDEKATNPFLRCDSEEVCASVEKFAGKKLNSEIDVFAWLRKWKDGF